MKPVVMSTTKGFMIRIRNFETADIGRVMEIDEEAFLEGDANLYIELYKEWPEGFIVAERNERVIGFEILILTPEEEGRVFALAVDSRFRGKGVGRALLKTGFNLLRKYKIGFVRLEVRVSNWIAQRLYKSMGFTEIGFVPFYYKDGEAAILMRKVL